MRVDGSTSICRKTDRAAARRAARCGAAACGPAGALPEFTTARRRSARAAPRPATSSFSTIRACCPRSLRATAWPATAARLGSASRFTSGSASRNGGLSRARPSKLGDRRPHPFSATASSTRVRRTRAKAARSSLAFEYSAAGASMHCLAEHRRRMPLPPYIAARRPPTSRDADDYQTIFARRAGRGRRADRGAAFHPSCLPRSASAASAPRSVTLHVGAGTFLPVKAEDTADHRMHAEWGAIAAEAADAAQRGRRAGGRIVAVGTTSLRLLESADRRRTARSRPFSGETALFITPGYRFRAVDRADDQFPSAALDAVHAGLRLLRARSHAARLCPRHRARATASIPMAMPACSFRNAGGPR